MKEIKPLNNNGSIQLKFSVGGKRYSFNPIPGGDYANKRDLAQATAIATRIQNDILAIYFDTTLQRYRLAQPAVTASPPTNPKSMLHLWDEWVSTLDISPATKADHYEMVRRMLLKAEPELNSTLWLTEAKIAPSTYNKRLGYIKSCFLWAVKEGKVEASPFEKVKPRKVTVKEVKPFSTEEMLCIVAGFEQQAPHDTPFVRFLLLTGVRLSEAIGLRWGNIAFNRNEVVIRESLSKDRTDNGYSRIRKETKTGSVRYLTMNAELRALLLSIQPSPKPLPDALVFTTVTGCIIDSGNFWSLWKKIVTNSGVPYRKPHAIRHTLLSHAVEQGIPLTGVAYLAGHANTRMVIQTYGHMVNRPRLPEMPV